MKFMQLALKNETGKGNIAAMYLCTKLQDIITLFSLQYPYLHFFEMWNSRVSIARAIISCMTNIMQPKTS